MEVEVRSRRHQPLLMSPHPETPGTTAITPPASFVNIKGSGSLELHEWRQAPCVHPLFDHQSPTPEHALRLTRKKPGGV
ncbi:hypothetical protein AALO_G00067570 [Alosa alosa]|uniref:Uncharacterized protein n=1 Tax=Alosa alosa TaxID=278164 RepID=A0AAV6H181_9TELE|nr:hypothetical protein AALO_G00067570 [Alosa alosa]